MKGILFDLDGVFYVGESPVAGAAEVVDWATTSAVAHLFVTNTTSRPRDAIVEKLARFGLEVPAERILTPAVAAVEWLHRHEAGPLALFVPAATAAEFAGFDVLPADADTGAGAVVIGDLGTGWNFQQFNRAFRLLMATRRPTLIALGLTRYWRADDGLRLDTGPFVRALEYASGAEAVVTGKPAAPFFATGAAQLGLPPAEILMVGDDIRGDIEGAQRAGLAAVLVRTGKFSPGDLDLGIVPDAVLPSVTSLPDWWLQHAGGPGHA